MLKLRTNKEVSIPYKRGVVQGVARLIIERFEGDINNIRAIGYYYFIDENNSIVKLDDFGANAGMLWQTLDYLEANVLSVLESNISLKANFLQRIKECTLLQIDSEAYENFGTSAEDWEDDIEETPTTK